jgi:Fibronectin type III domain
MLTVALVVISSVISTFIVGSTGESGQSSVPSSQAMLAPASQSESSGCGAASGFGTTLCETIDYQNYTLPGWPGSFYFQNQSGTARAQDGIVTSMLVPWHQQTIFYVNETRTLVGYDTATASVRNLTQWQTNFTSPTDVLLFNYYQNVNGTLGALFQVGNPTFGATNPRACYWWVQLYDFQNGTYYDVNTTVNACVISAGWALNGHGELIDATGMVYNLTQGWVIFGQNTFGRMYAFNIFTGTLVSTSSLPVLPDQGNSFALVPSVNQVLEDNNNPGNQTVGAGTVYLTLAGQSTTFHERQFWSPPCSCISGIETNNIPYFFWKLSSGATEVWESGVGIDHSEVMLLESDADLDSFRYVNSTPYGPQDVATAAEWAGSGLGLTGSVCFANAANGVAVLDAANGGNNWFNKDFCTTQFGFHGGGWLTPPSVYVSTNGTSGALMYGGYLFGGFLAEGSRVLVYNLSVAVPSAPSSLRSIGASASSISLSWTNPSGIITDDSVEQWTGTSCSAGIPESVDLGGNDSSFTWGGLASNGYYSFEVAAATAAGFGPESYCVSANTSGLQHPPTSLVVSAVTPTTITWSWVQSTIAEVSNDTLYLYGSSGCTALIDDASTNGAATSVTVDSLTPSTSYYAAVTAWNASGQTIASSCALGFTAPPQVGAGGLFSTTFVEAGLPASATWYINVSSSAQLLALGTNTTLATGLPNGTYDFTVATNDPSFAPNYYDGSVVVNGSASTAAPIAFALAVYPVTFTETGLPSGADWSATLGGSEVSAATSSIRFAAANGSYAYAVASNTSLYAPTQYSGVVTVSGSGVSEPVTFVPVSYPVSFSESGLPAGAIWYVNITGGASLRASGATGDATTALMNGTYEFAFATNDKTYTPSYTGSSVTVAGAPTTESVAFAEFTRAVTFTEKGLPSPIHWNVTIGSVTESSTTSKLVLQEANGTYAYHIGLVSGYHTTDNSQFTVSGTAISVSIPFVITTYAVKFTESGVQLAWTSWCVTFAGAEKCANTSGISFSDVVNGSYRYALGAVTNYSLRGPNSGTLIVSGGGQGKTAETVASHFALVTYKVTFKETGLKKGTSWWATFNGGTKTVTTPTVSFTASNGTYSFSAGSNGYASVTGNVTLDGAVLSRTVAFG